MPICPVAAANGVDAVPKLRAPHADGDFDGYLGLSLRQAHRTHQARYRGNPSLAE